MDEASRRQFMRQAIDLALEGVRANRGGPFGSVIVRGERVIAAGCNQVTSTNDPTAHAEIVAIRAACGELGSYDLSGCELFASCEPCPMCLAAIHWARIARVHYACDREDAARAGFDDALLYEEIARPRTQRRIVLEPLMRDEGLAALRAWTDKPDRRAY
jgi:tRNA(Arg) A34 adenosine deaminase TadA